MTNPGSIEGLQHMPTVVYYAYIFKLTKEGSLIPSMYDSFQLINVQSTDLMGHVFH